MIRTNLGRGAEKRNDINKKKKKTYEKKGFPWARRGSRRRNTRRKRRRWKRKSRVDDGH